MVKFSIDLNEQGERGSSIVLPPELKKGDGSMFSEMLRRRGNICHHETHTQLKIDLIENIWKKFGTRKNNYPWM